jgi:MFS family permease
MNENGRDMKLFWTCFVSLIATSFGFIVRANLMDTWGEKFGLNETQKGEIFGVGLWPFAISIVLFSLIVDKIGYRTAMIFAFICHAAYMVIVISAPTLAGDPNAKDFSSKGYWVLYIGSFIGALGNGTIEAVINPVVATMFNKDKTKWLNILHAGWPGGLVLGGLLALALEPGGKLATSLGGDWRMQVGLVGIPVAIYGLMLFVVKFPVNERVAAGVPFRDMLKEVGFFGAFLVSTLIVFELANVLKKFDIPVGTEAVISTFNLPVVGTVDVTQAVAIKFGISVAIAAVLGFYTLSLGRPLFVFLMLIMIPLAITELGTDSWIGSLMKPELGGNSLLVLLYTSFIMMVLRFFAGPIVHKFSPLGLLAISSAIAAAGLFSLSMATGYLILAAATLYAFGKTFFWPTMLGTVSEQFPKGGALTLNAIGGLGMMAVGILGAPLIGNIQDKSIDQSLKAKDPGLHDRVVGEKKTSLFGEYQPLDTEKVKTTSKEEQTEIGNTQDQAKKNALKTVALFPVGMFVAYMLLIGYFKARGGYKPVQLEGHAPAGH